MPLQFLLYERGAYLSVREKDVLPNSLNSLSNNFLGVVEFSPVYEARPQGYAGSISPWYWQVPRPMTGSLMPVLPSSLYSIIFHVAR